MKNSYITVDQYVAEFPEEIQPLLGQIRKIILRLAPEAEEGISYGMPAYRLNGKPLVYYAAYPRHIGLYATPSAHSVFADKLTGYKQGKGSVQFPLNLPIPFDLIEQIVLFRVNENRLL
jgi:uncharacterized protein YdhG (YjbR/CyaY superfamily)